MPSFAPLTLLLLAAPPQTYELDAARSHVLVHVGKAGLLALAGHEHEVEAPVAEGRVQVDAENPAASSLELPLSVSLEGDELRARGQARLRQTAFGIQPISVAGLVKVKDELLVEFDLVARRAPEGAVKPR